LWRRCCWNFWYCPQRRVTGSSYGSCTIDWRPLRGASVHRDSRDNPGGQYLPDREGETERTNTDADTLATGYATYVQQVTRRTRCIAKSSPWIIPYTSCSSISPSGY